ncbi:hypothetical protein [Streptomyces synnematoformans]|uniref:hypothetical protein n=1 Tax=Streptomyces synnematoformans TaxID=415721 RepID=UPI0031D9584B
MDRISDFPEFKKGWEHVREHSLTDVDPWIIYSNSSEIESRTSAVNSRYSGRIVVCFAERVDTDDVACLIVRPGVGERAGDVVVLHDFSSPGSEIDVTVSSFWDWFRIAVDDMIDIARHS